MFADILSGVVRTLLGAYIAWIFGVLGVSAIRDKRFRRELLKTSRVSPPSTLFNAAASALLVILWMSSIWLCLDGILRIIEVFS